VIGPTNLAAECAVLGLPFVTFSSDLVFDGQSNSPYVESNKVAPLNVYGRTKVEAEHKVLAAYDRALVVRTSAFFGPWDEYNFATITLRHLARNEQVRVAQDAVVSPTYVPDLVSSVLDLLMDGGCGIWHMANAGALSWFDFGKLAASKTGISDKTMRPVSLSDLALRAPRPRFSALASDRAILLPDIEDAVARYSRECRVSLYTGVESA
jgi:dTDP-4-dehydrorhamnose reductase